MRSIFIIIIITLSSCVNDKSSKKSLLQKHVFQKNYLDSNQFLGDVYCYYVYQGVLDIKQITPDLFKKYIKGGALGLKFLSEYKTWIEQDKDGRECKLLVGEKFRFLSVIGNKEFAILLNNQAIIEEGKDPIITLNHELLHVAFSKYKDKRSVLEKEVRILSEERRSYFIKIHPGYDFNKPTIFLKEYFSYTYQERVEEGLALLMD